MDAWANRNSNDRSSREYSAWSGTSLDGVEWAGRFWSGDIALYPAEHKRAAATLHRVPVDLRPVSHKIVDSRDKGQTHHQPDGSEGEPAHPEGVAGAQRPCPRA